MKLYSDVYSTYLVGVQCGKEIQNFLPMSTKQQQQQKSSSLQKWTFSKLLVNRISDFVTYLNSAIKKNI
jgi:hypothetical protein